MCHSLQSALCFYNGKEDVTNSALYDGDHLVKRMHARVTMEDLWWLRYDFSPDRPSCGCQLTKQQKLASLVLIPARLLLPSWLESKWFETAWILQGSRASKTGKWMVSERQGLLDEWQSISSFLFSEPPKWEICPIWCGVLGQGLCPTTVPWGLHTRDILQRLD